MHLIVCMDDRDGMAFGTRRVSSDREVCRRILQLVSGSRLWMNAYSAKLFEGVDATVSEDFLTEAGEGEYAFCENTPIPTDGIQPESVILFRWNRRYPATVKFSRELLQKMHLTHTEDFPGNSHDKITMERYCL